MNILSIMLFISLISYNDTQHTRENMSNPYQLRQTLLAQAEGILMSRYQQRVDQIRFEQACIERTHDHGSIMEYRDNNGNPYIYPIPPTTEDIIAEAKKLYNFIKEK